MQFRDNTVSYSSPKGQRQGATNYRICHYKINNAALCVIKGRKYT